MPILRNSHKPCGFSTCLDTIQDQNVLPHAVPRQIIESQGLMIFWKT